MISHWRAHALALNRAGHCVQLRTGRVGQAGARHHRQPSAAKADRDARRGDAGRRGRPALGASHEFVLPSLPLSLLPAGCAPSYWVIPTSHRWRSSLYLRPGHLWAAGPRLPKRPQCAQASRSVRSGTFSSPCRPCQPCISCFDSVIAQQTIGSIGVGFDQTFAVTVDGLVYAWGKQGPWLGIRTSFALIDSR